MGDRRDYFEAEADLFEMVRRIAQGRKQREIDPTLAVLRSCAAEAKADRDISPAARAKLDGMLEFVGTVDRSFGELMRLPAPTLMALLRMGGAIGRMVTGTAAPRAQDRWSEWPCPPPSDTCAIRTPSARAHARAVAGIGDSRFRALVGEAAWRTLPPAVRRRFSKRLGRGETALYRGARGGDRAFRCRPPAGLPGPGHRRATAARRTAPPARPSSPSRRTPGIGGQIWTRSYARPGRFPAGGAFGQALPRADRAGGIRRLRHRHDAGRHRRGRRAGVPARSAISSSSAAGACRCRAGSSPAAWRSCIARRMPATASAFA